MITTTKDCCGEGEGGIGSDNNFRIILYFSKDFEEHVTCIKLLNYCNLQEKSMFKGNYSQLSHTVYLIKAIIFDK